MAGAALTAGTSTTYTYRLTAAAPAMTVEKTAQEASVRVGEQIHYTITVRNTGNVPLTDVTIEDTLWSAGTVIRVGDIDHTLSDSSYTISSIGVGDKVIITYAYTAAQTDVAAGVTNTAAVTADEIEDAVTDTTDPVPVTAYSLTYDANGGRIAGETTFVVPDLAQQTGYELGKKMTTPPPPILTPRVQRSSSWAGPPPTTMRRSMTRANSCPLWYPKSTSRRWPRSTPCGPMTGTATVPPTPGRS